MALELAAKRLFGPVTLAGPRASHSSRMVIRPGPARAGLSNPCGVGLGVDAAVVTALMLAASRCPVNASTYERTDPSCDAQ